MKKELEDAVGRDIPRVRHRRGDHNGARHHRRRSGRGGKRAGELHQEIGRAHV